MSEIDDEQYGFRIRKILHDSGFGWVVEQVDAQIAEGKPSQKQVTEREVRRASAETDFLVPKPRLRAASLLTTEQYSQRERLKILLDAVEAAIAQRAAIEQALFKTLSFSPSSIRFEPDENQSDAAHAPFSIGIDRAITGYELEMRAVTVLRQIRERNSAGT